MLTVFIVVGRIMVPKMSMPTLIPETCEYVTSHSKGTLQMFPTKDLKVGRLSWIIQGAKCHHKHPDKRDTTPSASYMFLLSGDTVGPPRHLQRDMLS